ncbi:hypothetical protein FS837_009597 [Tulasnella sp. UAMH 9824]|nr:hypothetical protein FS837_009597 [Tulasnella sp. UAMH 9824]
MVRFAGLDPEDEARGEGLEDDSAPTAPGSEIQGPIKKSAEAKLEATGIKKKDKMKARHDAFVQRLASTSSPYARPGEQAGRKRARKSNQPLLFGMEDMNSALDSIFGDDDGEEWQGLKTVPKQGKKQKPHMIGESTTKMTSAQMKRILRTEQKRQPLIQQHPAFAANPFATIRLHAENTLVQHNRSKESEKP